MKILLRISAVFLLGLASAASALAQQAPPLPTAGPSAAPIDPNTPGFSTASALKVAPVRFEADVNVGETKRGVVDVFNVSTKAVTVKAEAENSRMIGGDGALEFYLGDNPYKLNSFVQVDPAPFVLQPGEARRVAFAISVPAGIYPGGYYGALFMTLVPQPGDPSQTQVDQGARVGTLLLITVPGDVQRQGRINSVSQLEEMFSSRHTVIAHYQNTGNTETKPLGVAVRPVGEVKFKNTFGRTVKTAPITGELVYPGAERSQTIGLSKPLWFGHYTAEVSLAAEPGGTPSVQSVRFWAFSPAAILLLGLLIAGGTIAMFAIRKKRRKQPKPPVPPGQTPSLMHDAKKPLDHGSRDT